MVKTISTYIHSNNTEEELLSVKATLSGKAHRNAVFHEDSRRENGGQMVHEVRVVLKQLGGLFLHRGLQTLSVGWRHSIPCLGLSPGRGGGQLSQNGTEKYHKMLCTVILHTMKRLKYTPRGY